MSDDAGVTCYFYCLGQLCQTWFPAQEYALTWLRKTYNGGKLHPRDLRNRDGLVVMDTIAILNEIAAK